MDRKVGMTTITENQKLQAFALFVIAINRSNEANIFHQEAAKVLGVDPYGALSDAIFGWKNADASLSTFEDVLRRDGIVVLQACNEQLSGEDYNNPALNDLIDRLAK